VAPIQGQWGLYNNYRVSLPFPEVYLRENRRNRVMGGRSELFKAGNSVSNVQKEKEKK
jgi:hypothetical protein